MLTTTAFDRSSSRWFGISDLIAEPEGPSPPSSVQLRTAVWTDDARDARHFLAVLAGSPLRPELGREFN